MAHNQVGCTGQHVDGTALSETSPPDLKTLACVCKKKKEQDDILQWRENEQRWIIRSLKTQVKQTNAF